jgi:hypothetical protein
MAHFKVNKDKYAIGIPKMNNEHPINFFIKNVIKSNNSVKNVFEAFYNGKIIKFKEDMGKWFFTR